MTFFSFSDFFYRTTIIVTIMTFVKTAFRSVRKKARTLNNIIYTVAEMYARTGNSRSPTE